MLNLELFLINYPAFRTFQKNISERSDGICENDIKIIELQI